jgi:small-conductance mechanosensitive channel
MKIRSRLVPAGVFAWLAAVPFAAAQSESVLPRVASPYEPGVIVLSALAILFLSGLLFRGLVRAGVVKSLVWLAPTVLAVSGVCFVGLHVADFRGFEHLYAFVRFMFLFAFFVAVLHPVANVLLPSRTLLTRGGVPPLLRGFAVTLLAVTGMMVLLSWSFPDVSFTPMFVTSGIVSVVVGLAVQDLLGNLLAGVVLSAERPFKVGDWVRIGAVEGAVTQITWRATQVRTREGDCIFIPNSATTKDLVTNYDRPTSLHKIHVPIGLAYETPCGVATAALLDAVRRVEGVKNTPEPRVLVKEFADSAVLYDLELWIDNYESLRVIESDTRREVWYSLKRHGLTIPFPQRDVYLQPVPNVPQEEHARLVSVSGPTRGVLYDLSKGAVTFGRNPDCTAVVSDPQVSGQHAAVERAGDDYRLRDLDSRHGTFLNGHKVTVAALSSGDRIRIGSVNLVFETYRAPVGARLPPVGPGGDRAPEPATDKTASGGADATQV